MHGTRRVHPAFRCTPTIPSALLLGETSHRLRPRPPFFPPSFPSPPPPVALIIPCMQSAELCAWEYKKKCGIALQVPPDTLHTVENSALVSNVILSHKAWWCIMCTHTRKSRMQSDAPAKETWLIAIINNDFGTSTMCVVRATIG